MIKYTYIIMNKDMYILLYENALYWCFYSMYMIWATCYVCNNIRRMRRGDDLLKITCARSTKEARDFIKEAVD